MSVSATDETWPDFGSQGLAGYACARDLFEAARDAAEDADRTSRTLASMEAREGLRAQSYQPRTRGGGGDSMSATDARIDYERRVRLRREEDYRLIDLACAVAYGSDQTGSGGVAAMLGPAHADALWWRYCAAATWPEVARGCGMSERWCQQSIPVSFDVIDSYGLARMVSGLGMAEG